MLMWRVVHNLFFTAVLFFTCLNTPVSAQEVDGPIAREHLKRQVLDLLYQERFAELEKMASKLRIERLTFPDGAVKLHFFYEALEPKNNTSDGWVRFMSKLKIWTARYPDSVSANNALAFGWMNYGWEARGGGYSNNVTSEGWRLLAERIGKAEALLEKKAPKPDGDCPERHLLLLAIAKAQGWGMPRFESLYHEAVTFDPTYAYFYIHKADFLDPRWYGEEGDWRRFAEETAKIPEVGKTLYMRLAWSQYLQGRVKSLEKAGISWQLMKQGFIDSLRRYPKSPWLLNNFCKFACLAGDKETAAGLFREIGGSPYIEAWDLSRGIGSVDDYKKWRTWALGADKTKAESFPSPEGTVDFQDLLILGKGGDAAAQYRVGQALERGEQIKQDRVEAQRWFRKAAEQGLRDAQAHLGMVNFNNQDFKEAAKWYYFAAMQGETNSPSSLARMYDTGYGLKKDLVQAYIWYSLNTQWKEKRVDEIAAILSPEQLAKAKVEVMRLRSQIQEEMSKAEITPLDPATIQIPAFRPNPSKLPEDFRDLLALAKSGDAEAQYRAGQALERGDQVKKDDVEAEMWLRKAAEQGLRDAQAYFGMVKFNGRDFKEAAKWYYIAAIQGDPNSPSSLARMYDTGYGLKKDLVQAYIWYSLNPRWKEKRAGEIAVTLSAEQLAKADVEVKRLRLQIQAYVNKADVAPVDPATIPLPQFLFIPAI